METLGSLLDKLSIEKIRVSQMTLLNQPKEKIDLVNKKVENLKDEINGYLSMAVTGEIPLEEPKYKFYKNENPSGDKFNNISDAMNRLIEANLTLWGLEDKRRDKTVPKDEIIQVCDDVAKWNRIRNDSMDAINSFLSENIGS